jgi:hypothetical protein
LLTEDPMRLRHVFAALSLFSLSACYHAAIETGLAPNADTIVVPWAHSFIYGLVPPATVSSAAKCKSGVAKVETQMSFLNGLVGAITWGIYTPLTITVTCSSGQRAAIDAGTTISVGDNAATALQQAVETARSSGHPVYVQF